MTVALHPATPLAHARSSAATAVASLVAAARARREPLRITGAGSWMDAGAPVAASRPLAVAPYAGITEYIPGDLVLTALAGTTMRQIAETTAAHGQWLPLDPFGSPDGTLGATVATGSCGPLAHANGGPRDLVIGIECVTGAGEIIRGGGRVTKNVAGFDLTRLIVGSWGTLGVITEISVRLRARPAVETTLAVAMPADADALAGRLAWIRGAPLEALAIELVDARLARRLAVGDATTLLIRLGGNAASVAAQRATVARGGEAREIGGDVWARLRTFEPAGAAVWRLSDLPSRVAATWAHAQAMTAPVDGEMHASVARGIVRCMCERDAAARLTPPAASGFGGTVIHERVPSDLWTRFSRPTALDPVSRRIRAAFDPDGVLNPGILGAEAP